MTLLMNALGEFSVPDDYDPDARRAQVYSRLSSIRAGAVDMGDEPMVSRGPRPRTIGEVRTCAVCGARFEARSKQHKYCSGECSKAAARERKERARILEERGWL